MSNRHPSEHIGPCVYEHDFDPEGTLREPDRSDDREQIIPEQHRSWGCPCWDCNPQLGPIAGNH